MTDDAEKMIARAPLNYSGSANGYAEYWSPVIRPPGRRLLEALPWDRVGRVLDVGTGTGALIPDILSLAPGARVTGVDPSWGMLARARGARVPLVAMDAMALGIRAGIFDIAVLVRHNLKNAAIPVVTIMGLQFGTLLGGAVVTETVFSWPGIGLLAIKSIGSRDYPIVQSSVLLVAMAFVFVNFLVDLAYGWLDPRIRYA